MLDERRDIRGERQGPRAAILVARRQGGAIGVDQLKAVGLDADRIDRLTAAGWLAREHRGVRRIGMLTEDGELWAAVLALGDPATISHLASGHEHSVLRGDRRKPIDVTMPTERRRRPGIRPHQARLDPTDITVRRGLRFTKLPRTLLDLAALLPQRRLEVAVDEARYRRRLHLPSIEATIARYPGHHGIRPLRSAVARHDPGRGMPREELERRAARFLRDGGYPPYRRNYEIRFGDDVFVVDVAWPELRIAIELDSRTFHDADPKFASDRRRIRRFGAAEWTLVPVTADDLTERSDELDADLWSIIRRSTSTNAATRAANVGDAA